jgi:hypothetical protein
MSYDFYWPSKISLNHVFLILNSRGQEKTRIEQVAVDSLQSTLKMEAIRSSETSVNKISTQRHVPEDGILQKNLYIA